MSKIILLIPHLSFFLTDHLANLHHYRYWKKIFENVSRRTKDYKYVFDND